MKYSAVIGLLSICVFRSSLATPTFGLVANLLNRPKHHAFPTGMGLHGLSGIGSGASDYVGSDFGAHLGVNTLDDDTEVNMHSSGGLGSLFGNTPGKTYGDLDVTIEDTANHPSHDEIKEDIQKYLMPGPVLPKGSGRPSSLFGNHNGEDPHTGLYGNHKDVSGSFGGVSHDELPSESDGSLHGDYNSSGSGESSTYKIQALKIRTLGRLLAKCRRVKAELQKLVNAKYPHHSRNIDQFQSDDMDYQSHLP